MGDSFIEWRVTSHDAKTNEVASTHRHFGPKPGFRIAVHQIVGRKGWFMTCHPMEIYSQALTSETLEAAQEEAVAFVEPWVYAVLQDMSGII